MDKDNMQTIIASETNTGFNFCTTEFSGEIENIGYNLYHYYDEEKKIDTLTSKNATRSLWPSDYDIEVSDDAKSNVEDYFDLLEFGEEHDVEFIYTYINGEWMVTNKDHENNYKPFSTLKSFFDGRPFHR
tara:strand:+ start:1672 stop:2061 length:390 start_codon:yes stop_codon:yes gene_type:complete